MASTADYLDEGRHGLTDNLAKETASESDDAISDRPEFVVEGSFHLGPHCGSICLALVPASMVLPLMGVEGIHSGLPLLFGRR
jgi:hypothetical protein